MKYDNIDLAMLEDAIIDMRGDPSIETSVRVVRELPALLNHIGLPELATMLEGAASHVHSAPDETGAMLASLNEEVSLTLSKFDAGDLAEVREICIAVPFGLSVEDANGLLKAEAEGY